MKKRICAIILTISMGILAGCSVTKENTEDVQSQSTNETVQFEQMAGRWMIDADLTDPSPWGTGISGGSEMVISTTGEFSYYIGIGVGGTGRCEYKNGVITVEIQPYEKHSSENEILTLKYVSDNESEHILMNWHDEDVCWKRESTSSVDNSPAVNNTLENAKTLTFTKEGETEQKQAVLMTGDGYTIYLPDGEWQQSELNTWTAVMNEDVRLWTANVLDKSIAEVEEDLSHDGYGEIEDNEMTKHEGEIIYKVRLIEFENGIWELFYCYPAESEEGWGGELPVIADTFTVSAAIDDGHNQGSGLVNPGTSIGAADRQEIKTIVDEFTAAYFNGDVDTIKKFLTSTYKWDISAYEGTGELSDFTLKGLSDTDRQNTGNEPYVVSLEYRDRGYDDTYQYLTMEFVKQEGGWKIQLYGLEK